MSPFHQLSRPALISLAAALETGRLDTPFCAASLSRYVPVALCQVVAAELELLWQGGMKPAHIAYTLRLLAQERVLSQAMGDRVELVWTGPEGVGTESRDTHIIARMLFTSAKRSVLISSYALDRGRKARELFEPLAARMETDPKLQVRLFVNVPRPYRNDAPASVLLREFAYMFRMEIWPGRRLPEVFYDPRSLSTLAGPKACLHAKCVVVDEEHLLVTSANFTEAAHERNIEAGVLIADPVAARAMRSQFETLVAREILYRVPGL